MSIEEELRSLCASAKDYGADRVSVLPADQVVVDPRVRLKCLVPACPHYGVSLMCPPGVMKPEEFKKVLESYTHTILVQCGISLPNLSASSLEELLADSDYLEALEEGAKRLYDVISRIERDAVNMGHRLAAGFGGGHCRLCDRCVGQGSGDPCKHPFLARPSMEAMGIDVFRTAGNAGMPLVSEGKPVAMWTGLLLVD